MGSTLFRSLFLAVNVQADMHTDDVPKKRQDVTFPPRISIEQGDDEEQQIELMI